MATAKPVGLETITDPTRFAAVAGAWDELVRAMPRPSPFMLSGWLTAWWAHYGSRGQGRIVLAWRDGRLVAGLALHVRARGPIQVASFLGGPSSALADLLLASGEDLATGRAVLDRARRGFQVADLFGLPADSHLARAAGSGLTVVPRVEAPVLDLTPGWEAVYTAKTSSRERQQQRRRRRRLADLGRLEVAVARTPAALDAALDDAFVLHDRRWAGRPDSSGFTSQTGMRFHRDAARALGATGVPRLVMLRIDDQPVAFHYYMFLCQRVYVIGLAFDPAFAKHSPGTVTTLAAIGTAAAEGATRVEFLGGIEVHKMALADGLDPLHQAVGLQRHPAAAAVVHGRLAMIRARARLKDSSRIHAFYLDGMAPVWRIVGRWQRSR